jgi:N-acetylneuraminic acid mutarotase
VISSDVLELARPVTSFGATVHEGALYTYGGYFGIPHAYSREGQSGELSRFDFATRAQTVVANGPGVQGAQLVSTPAGLVRSGGMSAENAKGEAERIVSLADVSRFDAQTGQWQTLTALPEARSSHAAVFLDGRLYVLGGWTLSGAREAGRFATDTLVLDLASGVYSKIAMPVPVRAAQAAVIGGKIVLVGGLDPKGEPQRSVHVLDPKSGAWSKGPDFPAEAFGVAVAGNGRAIFASARDGVLYALRDVAGTWEAAAYLAFPRFFHQMAMLGEKSVVVLGGISGMHHGSRIAHVEVIDTESKAPRTMTWTLKNPSPAKNRQGAQVVGDQLVLFGGNRSLEQHDFGPEDFRAEAFGIDLATMQVEAIASFPAARQTVQTTLVDKNLLALGGFGHDGQKARAQADAYTYDVGQGAWAPYASTLPSPRTQFGLVAKDGELWVFGGLDYDPSREEKAQFFHPTSVLKATQGQPFVVTNVNMPRPRRAFGGALLEGKYFLIGGMADNFTPVPECDAYDFASAAWSATACPRAVRISPQLVALDDKLYLAGGSTIKSASDLAPEPALEMYDAKSNTWSTMLDAIPLEPRHLTMQAYRHALLLYSAHRADQTVQIAMVIPPVTKAAPQVAAR